MEGLSNLERNTSQKTGIYTTVLSVVWGAIASYMLFYSLLITQHRRLLLVELVPLLAVWATLERKRWGRLTMIGLSLTLLGLFTMLVCCSFGSSELSPIVHALYTLATFYDINVPVAMGILGLAILSCFWFCSPMVGFEFNRNKRARLARSQQYIACIMVVSWGICVLMNPVWGGQPDRKPLARTPHPHLSSADKAS